MLSLGGLAEPITLWHHTNTINKVTEQYPNANGHFGTFVIQNVSLLDKSHEGIQDVGSVYVTPVIYL